MVSLLGRIALYSFLSSLTSLLFIFLINNITSFGNNVITDWFHVIFVIHALINHAFLAIVYYSGGKTYLNVSFRAALLGEGLSLGILLSLLGTNHWSSTFGLYLSVLSLFHFSEYLITSIINPKSLSLDSFLLNHSKEYGIAAMSSITEFTIEAYFWPNIKQIWFITVLGLILCIFGESLRKLAMITAGNNFNHIIQSNREEGHTLVTHGLYAICRHPSYVGWFYWSIGTQLILLNPICTIGYAIVSWKFFAERVVDEEITLLNFFGEEYVNYKRRVRSGLPFIDGYRCEL